MLVDDDSGDTEMVDVATTTHTPEVVHLVSQASQGRRRTQSMRIGDKMAEVPVPPDATEMAQVYCWWTSQGTAPWLAAAGKQPPGGKARGRRAAAGKKKATSAQGLPPQIRRSMQGNQLNRLWNDTRMAIERASSQDGWSQMHPFVGKTLDLKCGVVTAEAGRVGHLRAAMVFWSPTYLAADKGSLSIRGSNECMMRDLVERFMQKHKVDLTLSVTYVMPRWAKDPDGQTSNFDHTPPAALAYGLWLLGLRLCFLKPKLILTVGLDATRAVANTGGLDFTTFCTERAKVELRGRKLPANEPPEGADIPKIAVIKRTVASLKDPKAIPRTLYWPTKRSKLGGIRHLTCPHPYILKGKGGVHKQRSAKGWFARTMRRIVDVARECGDPAVAGQGSGGGRPTFAWPPTSTILPPTAAVVAIPPPPAIATAAIATAVPTPTPSRDKGKEKTTTVSSGSHQHQLPDPPPRKKRKH